MPAPVIQAIRAHSDNLIIVGTPFFSQRVDVASRSPITGVDNLAYTLHFYAGTHGDGLRDYARTALTNGIPLFVTEWGTVNASGDGNVNEASTREWMAFLAENNISHLNWAVNDKDEGASVLIGTEQGANNQGNWPLSLLTPSGLLTRDIIRNWSSPPDISNPPEPEQPLVIPGLIQAEDFDRQAGVRTETTSDIDGGQNIGFIEHNDYVEYDVEVLSAGTYTIQMRLASNTVGGNSNLSFNGEAVADVEVGFTGGWQDWVTVTTQAELQSGLQTLRVLFTNPSTDQSLLNVNWINFVEVGDEDESNVIMPPIYQLLLEPES